MLPTSPDAVILCGAGVSVAEPARMPTVAHFISELEHECFAQVVAPEDDMRRAFHGSGTIAAPRFEQVIAVLLEFDPELHCLSYLRVDPEARDHEPNALHYYLARHVHERGIVITTNFDALIELAYVRRYGADIAAATGALLKIHGSIQTTRDGVLVDAERQSMKADIFAVAAGTPITGAGGSLSELTERVSGRDLVAMGYSFSDSFDVTPALCNAAPRAATIIEYASHPLTSVERLECLPNFAEIEGAWRERRVDMRFLRGDPATGVPRHLHPAETGGATQVRRARLVPAYNDEQLRYLIARLLQTQDAYTTANELFRGLSQEGTDPDIRTRATYCYARTLPDWDQIADFEHELSELNAGTDIRLRAHILLLDAKAFIGPGREFVAHYARFKALLRGSDVSERSYVLNRAKAHHCYANYLMNRGRPGWAVRFAEASLDGRTRFGEPADIFFAEYGRCLALVLAGDSIAASEGFASLRRYAKAIGDQTSELCVAIVEGLYFLSNGDADRALERLEHARDLYLVPGQDPQIDPELNLYILETRVCSVGWDSTACKELEDVGAYVRAHRYTYFTPVVDAFERVRDGKPLSENLNRLTRAHLKRAGVGT